MKTAVISFTLVVLCGLIVALAGCSGGKSSGGLGGLPEALESAIEGEAPEGSRIISVQQASTVPDDSDTIKPEYAWCVVTESNGTRARWFGFHVPPAGDEGHALSALVKDAERDLFSKFGCTNWDGD